MENYKTRWITLIILLGFLLSITACQAGTKAKSKQDKYHLIYLVSAGKLEVGSKVFVDPIFFTDGKEIKGIWAYCRTRFIDKKSYLRVTKTEEKAMNDYCTNRPFSFPARNMLILSNNGARITLSSIKFDITRQTKNLINARSILAPPLALIGTGNLNKVSRKPSIPSVTTSSIPGPQYFFFASSNKNLVDKIVPVHRYTDKEMRPLLARARNYAEEVKGAVHRKNEQTSRSKNFANERIVLISPLFVDLDNDGLLDIAVSMRARHIGRKSRHFDGEWIWAAIGFLYGNGSNRTLGYIYQGISFRNLLRIGYALDTPLGIVKIGNCRYLVSAPREASHVPMLFEFTALPKESTSCKDKSIIKQVEDIRG